MQVRGEGMPMTQENCMVAGNRGGERSSPAKSTSSSGSTKAKLTPQKLRSMLVNKTNEVKKLRSLMTRMSTSSRNEVTSQQQAADRAFATTHASLRERLATMSTTLQKTRRQLTQTRNSHRESHRKIEAAILRIRRHRWDQSAKLVIQEVLDHLQAALVSAPASSAQRLERRHSFCGPGAADDNDDNHKDDSFNKTLREREEQMQKREFEQMEQFVDAQSRVEELEREVCSLTSQLERYKRRASDAQMEGEHSCEALQSQIVQKDSRIRRLEAQVDDLAREAREITEKCAAEVRSLRQRIARAENDRVEAFQNLAIAEDRLGDSHAEIVRLRRANEVGHEVQSDLDVAQYQLQQMHSKYAALYQELNHARSAHQQLLQQLSDHENVNHDLELKKSELQVANTAVSTLALELKLKEVVHNEDDEGEDDDSTVESDLNEFGARGELTSLTMCEAVSACTMLSSTEDSRSVETMPPSQHEKASRRSQPLHAKSQFQIGADWRHESSSDDDAAVFDDDVSALSMASFSDESENSDSDDDLVAEDVSDLRMALRQLSTAMAEHTDVKDVASTIMHRFTSSAAAKPALQRRVVPIQKMFG